jgi:eukaryotic-like serine/threonine-protein kinase
MSQAAPERLIADRYAMQTILRHGRAGVVWSATDVVDGGAVAVEEIEPGVESEAERNQRWSRIVQAARTAATLEHPGVVRLLDVLLDAERYFVVTELADGLPLSELIDRHGQLPWRRVAQIGLEVLDVLEAAHRAGFAHLDLQPAHVLVAPDGAVRVAGFGLAALLPASRPGPVPAPEQVRGEPAGPPADLWALGATMFAAVEGQLPFEGDPAAVLFGSPRPCELAGPLAQLLVALLDKAPERRPGPAAVRERLREVAEGEAAAANGGPAGGGVPGEALAASASTVTPPLIARTPRLADAATSVLAPAPIQVGRAGEAVGRAARAGVAAGRAARAQAGARLGAPGWGKALDWMLDPSRRGLVVGTASVVLALLSFALIVAVIGNPTGSGSQTRAAAPAITAAVTATSAAPTTTTTPPTTAPALPAGWTVFADDTSGYRIAYPASWEVARSDDRTVEFHDRSVPTIMRIGFAPAPVPDPVAAQVQSSQQHAAAHQGSYQQTRLDPTNFQGRPGAVLEFTFLGDDQQPYRAVELGTNTPPGPNGPGYWVTIFVQSREVDWGVAQSLLQTALNSFVPPPS